MYLDHLLRDLELLHHPDLIVHLDAALHQFHLCAVKIGKLELVDLKLLDQWRQVFFLTEEQSAVETKCIGGNEDGQLCSIVGKHDTLRFSDERKAWIHNVSVTSISRRSSSSHSQGSQPWTSLVFWKR